MKNRGILYGVGVGPGDPELLTLQAVRILKQADVICIPESDKGSCTAWNIAKQAVREIEEKELLLLPFPMTKESAVRREFYRENAEKIASFLEVGKNVAFLTIGDPTVYSTYMYMHHRVISLGYSAVIINGVPSFCAVAAALGTSLGEHGEEIHILPASYPIEQALDLPGTKILMKVGRNLKHVKELLLERDALAVMVENCGMEGERKYFSADEIPEQAGYYSMILVKSESSDSSFALRT